MHEAWVFRLEGELLGSTAGRLPSPGPGMVRFAILEPWREDRAQSRVFSVDDFDRLGPTEVQLDEAALARGLLDEWLELYGVNQAADRDRERQRVVALPARRPSGHVVVASVGRYNPRDAEFEVLVQRALHPEAPSETTIAAPFTSDGDIALALRWMDREQSVSHLLTWPSKGRKWLAESVDQSGCSWDLAKMISARVAERAAEHFLRSASQHVDDVSASQLFPDADDDWTRCDLRVRSDLGTVTEYDVKNARKPWGRGIYTRFIVPKFKLNRDDRSVQILGTLSEYRTLDDLLGLHQSERTRYEVRQSSIQILGITSLDRIIALQNSASGGQIVEREHRSASPGTNSTRARIVNLLPAWLFELPTWLDQDRSAAVQVLRTKLRQDPSAWEKVPAEERAVLSAALFFDPRFGKPGAQLSEWEVDFFTRLLEMEREVGLGVPGLVLAILAHFTRMVRAGFSGDPQYRPAYYARHLWKQYVFPLPEDAVVGGWNTRSQRAPAPLAQYPLGLFDPTASIANLIRALDTLWEQNRTELSAYETIKLRGWQILSARHKGSGASKTILAYCGGHTSVGTCGAWPLVAGGNEHCTHGRLRCPRCGYCCSICCPNGHGPNHVRPA